MNVSLICDLSEISGLGHFNRMKVLYNEFKKNKIKCSFIFPLKNKKFIDIHASNFNKEYFHVSHLYDENAYLDILKKNSTSIVIIDSYEPTIKLENILIKNDLFVVIIDDHLRHHNANIVFNNRSNVETTSSNPNVDKSWSVGPSYCLINDIKKKSQRYEVKNILLHAGGASYFETIETLTKSTIQAVQKYELNLDILCVNQKSKKYIQNKIEKLNFKGKYQLIPFKKNFKNCIHKYDVVVGPAGTTTFETIMAHTLPFTVPLKNDGRDDLESWLSLGHMMHMSYKEAQTPKLLDQAWDVLIKNFKILKEHLITHSEILDGYGPTRVLEKILELYNNKNDVKLTNPLTKNMKGHYSTLCLTYNSRDFLNSRNNLFVRKMSSNPDHVISWPEHVDWWLKPNIYKFSMFIKGQLVAFHWFKSVKDKFGEFIVSGWFPIKKSPENLKISNLILGDQLIEVKRVFKDKIWIIIMNKNNKFVYSINKRAGFKDASEETIMRAKEYFLIKKDKFFIMEMKL